MFLYSILIICLLMILSNEFHIDVVQEKTLKYNGQKITEHNIKDFLRNHERMLIFGDNTKYRKYTIVNVRHKKRSKRSNEKIINFNIDESVNNLKLKFIKSANLIDNEFVYINRYENSSVLLKDFDKLKEKHGNCFYRNLFSAIDICEGTLRGILQNNLKNFFIHPLPKRFGEQSHIIFESNIQFVNDHNNNNNNNNAENNILLSDFEPKIDEFEPSKIMNNNIVVEKEIGNNFTIDFKYNKIEHNHDNNNNNNNNNNKNNNITSKIRSVRHLKKRYIGGNNKQIPKVLHIETAIFVDKDLYKHMLKNYPKDTESNLIRFVLAMINGVQLLYNHPSLGYQINFVLKRLEILHSDPKELHRSSDIDIFLNSFCLWQRKFNPISDADAIHFDHAVILTGLDLYVVSKNGKISSQVVGLAPVAGMCTATSSCTINEGKHFESVFVVAHEIGHNLGMRHDTPENNCDPSLYIMSPTLGSGKITWSQCSRNYLRSFLESQQAVCLLDRGQFGANLDHSAEGILPGERFDANQQCMLKYGKDSMRSKSQPLTEICRDLHCQRDRYTWTSHPALEGTHCGEAMCCKSGVCTLKTSTSESYSALLPQHSSLNKNGETLNLIESLKYGGLKQEYNFNTLSMWSEWSQSSECDSGCLYGESGRLSEGSTGLKVYSRTCMDYRWTRKKCDGPDKKYEACLSKQCYEIPRTTINEFANQICERAEKFDSDILKIDAGTQEVKLNPEDSCKVYCKTKNNDSKTKSWTYPDGTTCKNQDSDIDDTYYCVNGRCEKFTCENSSTNYFKINSFYCPENLILEKQVEQMTENITPTVLNKIQQENGRDYKTLNVSPHRNEEIVDATDARQSFNYNEKRLTQNTVDLYANNNKHTLKAVDDADAHNTHKYMANKWAIKSGCHFSCIDMSKGIQIIVSNIDHTTNIQLCEPEVIACKNFQTPYDFSSKLCSKYQLKVRGLSGNGMQISASIEDPDRSCKVACQDVYLRHRFYLVNGEQGYFPFGTKCSRNKNRYCVNGKCLEFGLDKTPLNESFISLALYRNKRDSNSKRRRRIKRNFISYNPINITEKISQQLLDNIIANLELNTHHDYDKAIDVDQIDFNNPVNIPLEDDYMYL